MMDPRYPSDDLFRLAGRRHIAVPVRKADDAVAVGDIDPFGVRPERIERDPEWLVEPAGEDFVLGRQGAASRDPKHAYRVGRAVGDKQVTVRRQPDGTRTGDAGRHHLDRKTGRHLRPDAGRHRSDFAEIRSRFADRR